MLNNFIVSGVRDGIANAIREIVTLIAEAPLEKKVNAHGAQQFDMYGNALPPTGQSANRNAQGSYQMKVLIPKIASAAIIGKGGCVVKKMSDISGCRYQLGDENDPFNTRERIVTVSATSVSNLVLVMTCFYF